MSHVYRSIGFSHCEICWIESRPLRPLGGIFLEDKAVMKRLKPGQLGLFDVPMMPVCLTALQHRTESMGFHDSEVMDGPIASWRTSTRRNTTACEPGPGHVAC